MQAVEAQSLQATTPVAEESTQKKDPDQASQFTRQLKTLFYLYQQVPSNTLDDEVKRTLHQILSTLQTFSISEILAGSYKAGVLDKHRAYALEEYEKMGKINRERMQSLVDISTEEMQKTILESLLLFDVNPEVGPLEISKRTGIDDEGRTTYHTTTYPVFQKGALAGIEGLKRFLPESLVRGEPNTELPGMQSFLRSQFAGLSNQLEKMPHAYIKALTTIGSLGGIGHKSDSDMDAQVIFDTNPQFNERWNDGDFFVALLKFIFHEVGQAMFNTVLTQTEKRALETEVESQMREKFQEGLNEDESRVIHLVLPSIYQKLFEVKVWKKFRELESSKQALLLWEQICHVLQQYPYFEKYIMQLSKFFSFIKINYDDKKIREDWFSYSLTVLSQEKVWEWISRFYLNEYLDPTDAQQMLRRYAKQQQMEVQDISEESKQDIFLEHLAGINQRGPVIKAFLKDMMQRVSLDSQHRVADVLSLLVEKFDRKRQFLVKAFSEELEQELKENFRAQMVKLVDAYSAQEAVELEAKCEFALRRKIYFAEDYLTRKYPETEVHFFTNILRNQRQGQHTPFLVSPEGSMAYDLMLNDFLLNPAVILAGASPIPFRLPHDLKMLCRIKALPESEWTLKQTDGDQVEAFPLHTLPDWGDLNIPRQKFLEHAIPMFLRESEKISHRNLPKALLNCWWVEMICLEEEDQPLTSLTHLLFNPDQRYFIREEVEDNQWVTLIKLMEKEYPQLVRDPWWLKFTEMLLRFDNENVGNPGEIQEIQEQMVFCFSQHIRLSDIINFNNNGQAMWLEEEASWRIKSLVSFYNYFYKDEDSRKELMKFAQGRDDVAKQIEKKLKILFLQSLRRVEQKLLDLDNGKALKLLMGYILKIGGDIIGPKANTVATFTLERLQEFHQNILIVDQNIVRKVESEQPLTDIEKMQWQQIQEDRKNVNVMIGSLIDYYEYLGLTPSPSVIEKHIFNTRIKLAGDPLENVIFQYHFKRNFKRKPYQVPFPISKSLSIPRKRILLNNKKQKWVFQSVLSKSEVMGPASRYANRVESEIEMFEAPLVEGIARCVFSGYLGFSERNLTSFVKPPARAKGTAASNPVTQQDLQILATEMYALFQPIPVRPRELLENVHYIRDIMMVCNVNRFNTISLVVRDNFGDFFVVGFNLDRIQVKVPPSLLKIDFNLARFFLQFNTRQCRRLFMKTLGMLEIPLRIEYPHRLKIWINTGNFKLLVAPKFYRIYLDGIIHSLWNVDLLGTPDFIKPKKLIHNFDFMGQDAIKNRVRESVA